MDHLSSCYFCGTALDEPLQNYRIVPAELREDDAVTTATLCLSCHDKLERLLAPVVEAAGGSEATLDATAVDRTAAEGTSGSAAVDDTRSDEPTEPEATDASPAVGVAADEELVDVDASLVDADDRDAGPVDDDSDGTGDQTDSPPVEDSARSSGAPGASESRDVTDTDDEASDAQSEESTTARTTVSALEYNKVMRLLQNREFPVDRAEIQTVAANAYGLAEHECAEVIDLAIDRGLVAERDGQLVRPQ